MAEHTELESLLRESLPQYTAAARLCLGQIKSIEGSNLKFPAATLLFAVVDAIGSYHRGREGFTVLLDGEPTPIRQISQHIYILNSNLFALELPDDWKYPKLSGDHRLSRQLLDETYEACRNPLTHNAAIAPGVRLHLSLISHPAIFGEGGYININLGRLCLACETAVANFLASIEGVVPTSRAAREVKLKDRAKVLGRESETA